VRRIVVRLIEMQFRPSSETKKRAGDLRRPESEARRLMNELHQRALQADGNFDAMATRHSQHASNQHGGWLGWIGRGELEAVLDRVAFSLAKGQVSKVVKEGERLYLVKRIH
jgi:parvulin-like peptidyl-prolyl isomerase